jgi:uncharacterized GH25 family protein
MMRTIARPFARFLRPLALTAALTLVIVAVAEAHDMFLKPAFFFAEPGTDVLVRVLNGTFSQSENSIARPRVSDVSVVSPAGRTHLDTAAWSVVGDTSTFSVHTGAAGTYVLGVSTKASVIALEAKDFNAYLAEDGMPDVLAFRRKSGETDKPARERYSKHVKALIQVGSERSAAALTPLGYPAELVPLANPYALRVGDTLRVRTLIDGKSAARQYVLFGGRVASGASIAERSTRSDSGGVAHIPLRTAGVWYVKFIKMTRLVRDTVDYESKWATLTFQVR